MCMDRRPVRSAHGANRPIERSSDGAPPVGVDRGAPMGGRWTDRTVVTRGERGWCRTHRNARTAAAVGGRGDDRHRGESNSSRAGEERRENDGNVRREREHAHGNRRGGSSRATRTPPGITPATAFFESGQQYSDRDDAVGSCFRRRRSEPTADRGRRSADVATDELVGTVRTVREERLGRSSGSMPRRYVTASRRWIRTNPASRRSSANRCRDPVRG